MSDKIRHHPDKCDLAPPADVVAGAKSVLGSIDLDPYSSPDLNRLIGASRYYNREEESLEDIIRKDWYTDDVHSSSKRVFVGAPTGAALTRRLLNKTLKEYRKGHIDHAVIWIAHTEAIIRAPWIWDFPICIPFRRLRPMWYDDELDTFRSVSPSDWSAIIYLPPVQHDQFQTGLSRFHNVFHSMGRIVFNEYSGENDWEKSYQITCRKAYDFHS